jgi:diaminobutyrate-2-oxoglutarate transaminase
LIVDETQTGGGRLGTYFGFEPAGVKPDIVLMPSAIAGGLPISMLLMRPALDQWRPYEEVGIFQGNNIAFVAAAEFLSHWRDNKILTSVELGSGIIARALDEILMRFTDSRIQIRGKGLIWCIDFGQPAAATVVSSWALERGLVTEPAWIRDDVLLITPPLMIEEDVLRKGLEVLTEVVSSFLSH